MCLFQNVQKLFLQYIIINYIITIYIIITSIFGDVLPSIHQSWYIQEKDKKRKFFK